VRVLLVHSGRGGPNAKQRAQIIAAYQGSGVGTAVCASSALARGITTAIGWLYGTNLMRSFPSEQLRQAMDHLNIPSSRQLRIREVVSALDSWIRHVEKSSVRWGL
jgi:hypothetical protein